MNILSILAVIGAVVKGNLIPEDLCLALAEYSTKYLNHACAMFSRKPKTPHPSARPDTWVWIHLNHQLYEFPYYVRIHRMSHGEWIERTGDGGFANWCFDPSGFTRTNDSRLIVI